MKKNLKSFCIFAMLFATTMFTDCDKSDVSRNDAQEFSDNGIVQKSGIMPSNEVYSDEEIRKEVFFVGQGKVLSENNELLVTNAIIWDIARPSTACKSGFGFCRHKYPPRADDFTLFEDYSVYTSIDKTDWNNFVLELAYPSSLDMQFVSFFVEEDVKVFNKKGTEIAIIYADTYAYDKNVGKYGGYVLNSAYLK